MTMDLEPETPAEAVVLNCLREGKVARFERELGNKERTISASFLRKLAVNRLTDVSVAPLFIAIENAIIEGKLQLAGIGSTTAPLPPLVLANCEIMGGVDLCDSAWTSINLDCSRLVSLEASGLRVERSLLFNNIVLVTTDPLTIDLRDMVIGANLEARNLGRSSGGVCCLLLDQSHVGGSVDLAGAILAAPSDIAPALSMNGINVKSDVLLNWSDEHRFEARGIVHIVNATIGVRATFRGASVDNADNESLVMDGTMIGGDLLFDEHQGHRFEANGSVCLRGITVKNSLDFMGAKLHGRPDALLLIGAQIGANLIMRKSMSNRFEAFGAVGLTRATVGGEVRMQGARLSGVGERYALYMDEATVQGSAFLSSDGLHRFEAKGLVELYGAEFNMHLVLSGACVGSHLSLGESGQVVDRSHWQPRPHNDAKRFVENMALDLRQVTVHGKVLLGPIGEHRFQARGLVCLNGAKIGNELLLEGASLYNPRGYTLTLDSAQIARDISLTASDDHQFESRGTISGWGCSIGGGLYCTGASLKDRREEASSDHGAGNSSTTRLEGRALQFDQATIGGQVFLWHSRKFQFEAKGAVLFRHSRIEGDVRCDGACFVGRRKVTLSLNDSVITGRVLLKSTNGHRFASHGRICMERTQIGGSLDLTGAKLSNGKGVALNAADASIGGDVLLCSEPGLRFESLGELLFSRVTIKGRLVCRGPLLQDEQYPQKYRREERRRALSLYGGVVNDRVVMESSGAYRFEAFGFVDLSYTKIGAGVMCMGTYFENRNGTALSLESAKVTGDVYLTDVDRGDDGALLEADRFEACGDVDLQAVEISGDLTCDGTFRSERYGSTERQRGKALVFDNGYVRHRWYVRLSMDSVGEASLRGGRVGALDDDGGNNWGGKPERTKDGLEGVRLKLDGFIYERFGPWQSPQEPPEGKERQRWLLRKILDLGVPQNIWVTRLEWLKRQYPGDDPDSEDYFPQPHEQAAKALFAMGHHYDARRLLNDRSAHQTRCKADEWVSRYAMCIYSWGFGCGHLPNRALVTTAGWWLLGFAITWITLLQLDGSVILVKTANGIEVVRSFDNPDAFHRSPRVDPQRDMVNKDGSVAYRPYERIGTRDIACTADDIDAGLYALDTMLPVLDLHMEEKCEISSDWPILRILKAGYAMIGWIIVALAAFTCTGAFRRIPD